jgi:hypothetical protein
MKDGAKILHNDTSNLKNLNRNDYDLAKPKECIQNLYHKKGLLSQPRSALIGKSASANYRTISGSYNRKKIPLLLY